VDKTPDDVKKEKWICCQIGAREHYIIPAELQSAGQLGLLITDFWAKHNLITGNPITKDLQGRKHSGIPNNNVKSFNLSSLGFEISNKVKRLTGWELVMKRNAWFQKKTVNHLRSLTEHVSHIFCYSYAAKDIFKHAKSKGWKTILGQIDPGPVEEEIVLSELHRFPEYKSEWQPAPKSYWENWYEECELADTIVVNSEWSYRALVRKGVEKKKLQITPLSFSIPEEAKLFNRTYPIRFDQNRPLRVLFLGQVILRKGIARVIEAAQIMENSPVEFIIAGPIGIQPVPRLPNLKWTGRIPRLEANKYFKDSDLFLFPTLSDGFGLTQLEARAWKLPVITTPFCGSVIENGIDGLIISDPEAATIVSVLKEFLNNSGTLTALLSSRQP
jgi:glycosyltransferase involved in cell wall biosynthesis